MSLAYLVRATSVELGHWDIKAETFDRTTAFELLGRVMAEHDEYDEGQVMEGDDSGMQPVASMQRVGEAVASRGRPMSQIDDTDTDIVMTIDDTETVAERGRRTTRPSEEAEKVALPYLRGLRQRPPADAFPFPFPIRRGGTYALRNGGYVIVTNVNEKAGMCVGIKSCPDEYGEGFWMWHTKGPLDWATEARGTPHGTGDHPLDIIRVVALPMAPKP